MEQPLHQQKAAGDGRRKRLSPVASSCLFSAVSTGPDLLYLALAIACSLAIAAVFKLSERRGLDRMALLAVNYAAAAVLAAGLSLQGTEASTLGAGVVSLGVWTGALFIGGFWIFAAAIRAAGMALATAVMRLAVVAPVLASWAIWAERPSVLQAAGLLVAAAAIVLITRPSRAHPVAASVDAAFPAASAKTADLAAQGQAGHAFALLLALFATASLVDVSMKTFSEVYAADVSEPAFLLFVFAVACGIGVVAVVRRGLAGQGWPRPEAYTWGVGLGVVNYGSADFLLRAIKELSGPVVFPVNHISVVLGAALLGVLVWGERLSRANWAGLAVAGAALALLLWPS